MVSEKTKKFKSLLKGRLLIRSENKPIVDNDPFLDIEDVEDKEVLYELVEDLETDLANFQKGDYVTLVGRPSLQVFVKDNFKYFSVDPKAVVAIYENEA